MSEDEAFLAAVRANPADDTVRLVYADWLDERGDPRADFLRLDCHLRWLPTDDQECQSHQQRLNELGRALDRRWLAAVCRVPVVLDGTAITAAAWDAPVAGWTVSAGGVSAMSGHRQRNEDRMVIDPEHPIAIVLDGMRNDSSDLSVAAVGGESLRGVLAAGSRDGESTQDHIRRSLRTAHDAVRGLVNESPDLRGVGTTVVLATLRDGGVYVSWVGDSMAYRVSQQGVEPLTWKHDFRRFLIRHHGLSKDDLSRMSGNRVVRYLGDTLPDPIEVPSFVPRPGDRLILVTDGVDNLIAPSEYAVSCRLQPGPLACAEHLVGAARDRTSWDDATCVVIAFDGPIDPPPEFRPRRPWWRFWEQAL